MKILPVILYLCFSCFFLFLVVVSLLFIQNNKKQKTILSPIIDTIQQGRQGILSVFTSSLDQKVSTVLGTSADEYSIAIVDLKTSESYSQNPDRIYASASLYKLWVMAVVYQELNAGKLHKDDILQDSVADLNSSFSIASEEAELTEGTIKQSVNEALERTITLSDNYSAMLLTKKVTIPTINRFLIQEGLTHSKTGVPPTTTAADISLFLSKLYKKKLVSPKDSEEMIALLKRQAINDRIPKYLPSGIAVAHKTGELDQFKHDAGIVFTSKGDYIFVVLSATNNTAEAANQIAELSKQVYLGLQ